MKVTGTWLGEYTYGPDYESIAGRSVPFTMSLTESWLRRVTGYVRDGKGGQPERGRITGMRNAGAIEFVKTMPVGYITDAEGKTVETRAWLRRVFGIEEAAIGPHRIHYVGELSADGQSAAGRWQIRSRPVPGTSDQMIGGQGTWRAKRVADLPTEV